MTRVDLISDPHFYISALCSVSYFTFFPNFFFSYFIFFTHFSHISFLHIPLFHVLSSLFSFLKFSFLHIHFLSFSSLHSFFQIFFSSPTFLTFHFFIFLFFIFHSGCFLGVLETILLGKTMLSAGPAVSLKINETENRDLSRNREIKSV